MTVEELAAMIASEDRTAATQEQVAAFETTAGCTLPEPYRTLLMLTGGGFLLGKGRFLDRYGHDHYYSWLAALTDDQRFSLALCFSEPPWHPMPQGLLMIGEDSGGNPLALCLRGDRFGEVFRMDHEVFSFDDDVRETIEEAEDYGLAMPCASSFAELLDRTTP